MDKKEFDMPFITELKVFEDERGMFMEFFKNKDFDFQDIKYNFVQGNYSLSKKNVLRGLHYQVKNVQGKLIKLISGSINDVAVDIRKDSPYFGKVFYFSMKSIDNETLWIPPGFAHGFYSLEDFSELLYLVTDYYNRETERTILWNDETLNINWGIPQGTIPIVSEKDRLGVSFLLAEYL